MNTTARKLCSICNVRPTASLRNRNEAGMGSDMDFCVPCFDEAGWENTHSDGAHEDFEGLTVKQSNFRTKAALETWKAETREETKDCWICNPELNEAKREYTPRSGTSRAGMTINIPIRATGAEKAAEVIAKMSAIETTGGQWEFKTVKGTKSNGHVTRLVVTSTQESYSLSWDIAGRFVGGTVTNEVGKVRKVRNVAEVLRLAR